jgi:hypothetical protein
MLPNDGLDTAAYWLVVSQAGFAERILIFCRRNVASERRRYPGSYP